jgi:DNA-binding LacI/PurR family transcriptional regulator
VPASIRDVAARANVSPATVSRVLNGHEDVSAVLRDRVLAAVDDLSYRPYGPARSLRSRATTVLGIIVSDVTNPFFTSMVRGVEDVAQQRGYSVIIANADEDLRRIRWAICRASTQVKTCTRMLCSVQWCIGENDTTRGSLSCRKENSASDWDR